MYKFSWSKKYFFGILFCAATVIALPAQTFTTLYTFGATDGAPQPLVQATDGDFYGTTEFGGANDTCMEGGRTTECGTLFKITTGGVLTTLHSFDGTDGFLPFGALVQATNGKFYGTTLAGGFYSSCMLIYEVSGCGTVFAFDPNSGGAGGTLTTLHSFGNGTDGGLPNGGLVHATNGYFYGTTGYSAFKMTAAGALTTLDFIDGGTNGEFPNGGLVQAANGYLYGTAASGGSTSVNCADPGGTPPGGCGTVFKMAEGGALTLLHSFVSTDGGYPQAGVVQATDENFYGTTSEGGANTTCTGGCGTIFKITPGGKLTTLHSLDGTDGQAPNWLMQATDGNFYGTTSQGGTNNDGTVFVFKLNPRGTGGKLTTLHSFDGTDGVFPSGLFQATNGILYGTTLDTVFSLSVGLAPFVKTLPTSGTVGSAVQILGTNLASPCSVTFNGTPATCTLVSPSEISTTVPTGATSGTVKVVTPNGTILSNVPFRVRP